MINELGKAVGTQTALILELKRNMETITEKLAALQMKFDAERPGNI